MKRLKRHFAAWMVAALSVVLMATPAFADKLHLKDGRVLEGRVVKQTDTYVYFAVLIGGIEKEELFDRAEILKIESDQPEDTNADSAGGAASAAAAGAAGAAASGAASRSEVEIPDGATRIAFITLGEPPSDMVGTYINATMLRNSMKVLNDLPENERPHIVVLWINSGGGYANEVQKLSDVIEKEIKPKYRTVAWINSAISAAAMTAWTCNEIYMMESSEIGACTMFSMQGRAVAAKDLDLEMVLYQMEQISKRGGHDPQVMRAMQIRTPLSCDIDEDGNVTWYQSTKGQYLVNPGDEVLTLRSTDAVKYKVAKAIAETKDELAKALGCAEWVEVGMAADELQREYRNGVKTAEARLGELWNKLQIALEYAGNAPDEKERGRQIGRARQYLKQMRSLVEAAPSLKEYSQFTPEWFDEMDEQLRKMANPNA